MLTFWGFSKQNKISNDSRFSFEVQGNDNKFPHKHSLLLDYSLSSSPSFVDRGKQTSTIILHRANADSHYEGLSMYLEEPRMFFCVSTADVMIVKL